jgi:hypothetical protein
VKITNRPKSAKSSHVWKYPLIRGGEALPSGRVRDREDWTVRTMALAIISSNIIGSVHLFIIHLLSVSCREVKQVERRLTCGRENYTGTTSARCPVLSSKASAL